MKDKILAMLNAKNQRKAEIVEQIKGTESVEELKALSAEAEKLNSEIRDLEDCCRPSRLKQMLVLLRLPLKSRML